MGIPIHLKNYSSMLEMSSNVQVGEFRFKGVTRVEVESSWDNLTDTASITVPRKLTWRGRELATGVDPLIKRLDPVDIALGYNGQLVPTFKGFVRVATGDTPAEIRCEDAMLSLKGNAQTFVIAKCKLSTLLAKVLPKGLPFDVAADYELGTLRVSRLTAAQVLDELRQKFGVRAWFRDGTLYAGLAYVPKLQRRRRIHFESLVTEHSLEYSRQEDLRFKLKATIIYPNNTKQDIELGEPDGDLRSFHYYNVPQSEAKRLLEHELERLLVEGYSGSLTIFGAPHIRHGDIVELRSDLLPERDGNYLVKSVTTTFGPEGFRQNLTIDTRLP